MKILEITEFSAGICGVWARVLAESKELSKLGHKVFVFSSNRMQGSDDLAKCEDNINGIRIKRFKSKQGKFITRNVTLFNFDKEINELKPDMIITHTLHPHSFRALKYAETNNIPIYLVPHAPFNVKRNFLLSIIKTFYDILKIRSKIKQFTKVIAITRWELPHLLRLGVKREKIAYIPNGLPNEFFKQKKVSPKKDILFLGRITPIKDIGTLINAAKLLPALSFTIVGSKEKGYLDNLEIPQNIRILGPVYNLQKKIRLIDEHKIFVLPSRREAMPQVLLEAMARGKVVISSNTDGGREIIQNGNTGFLFEIGDYKQLAKLIRENISGNKKIQLNAIKESKKYSWDKLIKIYSSLFKK